jgi:hypothetical protein
MSRLRDRIDAELENIESSLVLLPTAEQLPYLSPLEQAGVAGLLHSFYNGVENILKQIVLDRGLCLPDGPSWHRDLLLLSADKRYCLQMWLRSLKCIWRLGILFHMRMFWILILLGWNPLLQIYTMCLICFGHPYKNLCNRAT